MKSEFERVIKDLNAVKVGSQFMARCPAHDDRIPSLAITVGDNGKAILHCHAGCEFSSVRAAVKSLGKAGTGNPSAKRVATTEFTYRDRTGNPSDKVVRSDFDDGSKLIFRQHLKNGKWINGKSGNPLQPYKYELWKDSSRVFIAEGEKCAEALIRHKVPATTTGGSESWKKDYAEYFVGKTIYVLPDNDIPGREYASQVFSDLFPVAKSVKIVELPSLGAGGDIYDWLHAGRTTDELYRLVDTTQDSNNNTYGRQPADDSDDFIRMDSVLFKEVKFLWPPYIPLGKVTALNGDPGCGKSQIISYIAACVSLGRALPGQRDSVPGNVVLFNSEDDVSDTTLSRLNQHKADLSKIEVFQKPLDLSSSNSEKTLNALRQKKPSLIVFDPVQCYVGRTDIHRANEVRGSLQPLIDLSRELDCAIVLVMHMNKSNMKVAYRSLGSIDMIAAVRSSLVVGVSQEDKSKRAMLHTKSNCAPCGPQLGYTINEGIFEWTGETNYSEHELFGAELTSSIRPSESNEAESFLMGELASGPVESKRLFEAAGSLGISSRTLNRSKKKLGVLSKRVGDKWFFEKPLAKT